MRRFLDGLEHSFLASVLLDSQAPSAEFFWLARCVHGMGIMDGRSVLSLALHCLQPALANTLATLCDG